METRKVNNPQKPSRKIKQRKDDIKRVGRGVPPPWMVKKKQ